jgi:hypothetical protein
MVNGFLYVNIDVSVYIFVFLIFFMICIFLIIQNRLKNYKSQLGLSWMLH